MRTLERLWRRKIAASILLLFVTACANGHASSAGAGCEWTRPICPRAGDEMTLETALQILDHNRTGARICGWTPEDCLAGKPAEDD